ncbi:GDP-mannose mannosyl hydrolase [Citrobacter braakii]|uniref:GDP-mannose mannosyl hydrolase n=1 Tax=Citrobacter braakii TaxID=57706 RepID=UPI00193E99C1|nr:GDP-mannose mannosyl hydrolase [Citrobacter braakii]ELN4155512.1 GDP-mannose mannosyl hydrolase [Citrobacter braakii]MBM3062559.1 GDP-mannose mannosyl hydrolase [Citrobacter braakii]MBM3067093.1 GDP-mannose mannosyl hydrolase [Citrobacter braakii]WBU71626.1 GDP-mannose mannosyl hydrolase [Citrobacter braakii]HEE9876589.1 GDP-mannose mannosyl hydrolase [Citrobacter braakii]
MSKRLEQNLFLTIVENTPLISIDLIVMNNEGSALLGQRQNRPAQHFWFVPGGRIFKDESFETAFKRITKEELGKEVCLDESTFLGVYEHFYSDNFAGADFSTHYVVHSYRLELDLLGPDLPRSQHTAYQWFDIQSLLNSNTVHQYTKNYFLSR